MKGCQRLRVVSTPPAEGRRNRHLLPSDLSRVALELEELQDSPDREDGIGAQVLEADSQIPAGEAAGTSS